MHAGLALQSSPTGCLCGALFSEVARGRIASLNRELLGQTPWEGPAPQPAPGRGPGITCRRSKKRLHRHPPAPGGCTGRGAAATATRGAATGVGSVRQDPAGAARLPPSLPHGAAPGRTGGAGTCPALEKEAASESGSRRLGAARALQVLLPTFPLATRTAARQTPNPEPHGICALRGGAAGRLARCAPETKFARRARRDPRHPGHPGHPARGTGAEVPAPRRVQGSPGTSRWEGNPASLLVPRGTWRGAHRGGRGLGSGQASPCAVLRGRGSAAAPRGSRGPGAASATPPAPSPGTREALR